MSPTVSENKSRGRGFDPLEVSLIVLLLSALAAVGVPWIKERQRDARAHAVAEELRAAAAAFQSYAHDRGDWPPADAAPGAYPTGMTEALALANWAHPTPIGGRYSWRTSAVHRGRRYTAAIAIVPAAEAPLRLDRVELAAIDAQLDDGDLLAGKFHLGFRNQPVFVLEH